MWIQLRRVFIAKTHAGYSIVYLRLIRIMRVTLFIKRESSNLLERLYYKSTKEKKTAYVIQHMSLINCSTLVSNIIYFWKTKRNDLDLLQDLRPMFWPLKKVAILPQSREILTNEKPFLVIAPV